MANDVNPLEKVISCVLVAVVLVLGVAVSSWLLMWAFNKLMPAFHCRWHLQFAQAVACMLLLTIVARFLRR